MGRFPCKSQKCAKLGQNIRNKYAILGRKKFDLDKKYGQNIENIVMWEKQKIINFLNKSLIRIYSVDYYVW